MDTAAVKGKDGKISETPEGAGVKKQAAGPKKTGKAVWKPLALVLLLSIAVNVGLALKLADATGRLAEANVTEEASRERYAALSSNIADDRRAISDSRAVFEKIQRDLNVLTARASQIQAEAGDALESLYAAERKAALEAEAVEAVVAADSKQASDSVVESIATQIGIELPEKSPADLPPVASARPADLD